MIVPQSGAIVRQIRNGSMMKKHPNKTLFLVIDIFCIMIIIGMTSFTFYSISQMPETIPIHSTKGVTDGWGSKWISLLMPGITVFVYVSLIIGIKYLKKYNYSILLMNLLKLGLVICFSYVNWDFIRFALGST